MRFAAMLLLGLARPIQFTSLGPEDSLNSKDGTAASRGRCVLFFRSFLSVEVLS